MIFMYDIIPDTQIRKLLDFFALIGAVPLLFLFFLPEKNRIRKNCKKQDRKLIPQIHISVADHDLSCHQIVIVIFRIKTVESFV